MPKLSIEPVATATTTEQAALTASQRYKLTKALREYAKHAPELKRLQGLVDKAKADVEKLREQIGADKLVLDIPGLGAVKATKIGGSYVWWDERYLLTLIDVDQLARAKVKKDKKPHLRVTLPGEKEEGE